SGLRSEDKAEPGRIARTVRADRRDDGPPGRDLRASGGNESELQRNAVRNRRRRCRARRDWLFYMVAAEPQRRCIDEYDYTHRQDDREDDRTYGPGSGRHREAGERQREGGGSRGGSEGRRTEGVARGFRQCEHGIHVWRAVRWRGE